VPGNDVYHQPSRFNRDNSNNQTIDLSYLAKGVYFVRMIEEGRVEVKKVVVE